VWPCCSGSNLDCDSGSMGSTPIGHPKEFLCSSGGVAQRNSLQIRKTVSSNLTCYSNFNARRVQLVKPPFLQMGLVEFDSLSGYQFWGVMESIAGSIPV
jgi:hypothetical protein